MAFPSAFPQACVCRLFCRCRGVDSARSNKCSIMRRWWMSGLLSALDELAAAELDLTSDCDRGPELKELYSARARLDAQINRRLAVFDARGLCESDGAPSTQSWLRGHLRLAPGEASSEVQTA